MRKQDWQDLVAESVHEVSKEDSHFTEGRWLYRGEVERQLGMAQAMRFIAKGKWEKGEDSDGDSVYRKVQKGNRVAKTEKISARVKKSMQGSADDMAALEAQLSDWFGDEKDKHQPKKQKKGSNADTAQERNNSLKGSAFLNLIFILLF